MSRLENALMPYKFIVKSAGFFDLVGFQPWYAVRAGDVH